VVAGIAAISGAGSGAMTGILGSPVREQQTGTRMLASSSRRHHHKVRVLAD